MLCTSVLFVVFANFERIVPGSFATAASNAVRMACTPGSCRVSLSVAIEPVEDVVRRKSENTVDRVRYRPWVRGCWVRPNCRVDVRRRTRSTLRWLSFYRASIGRVCRHPKWQRSAVQHHRCSADRALYHRRPLLQQRAQQRQWVAVRFPALVAGAVVGWRIRRRRWRICYWRSYYCQAERMSWWWLLLELEELEVLAMRWRRMDCASSVWPVWVCVGRNWSRRRVGCRRQRHSGRWMSWPLSEVA